MYNVGIYIRLSKEDINKIDESKSIINQRNLIKTYVDKNNLTIKEEYVDDGYSGTTFDRPAFNKMIKDIENGTINMVITKDLSRLGRDYIQSGYYIEQYFPLKNVRYVSILDNIDTSIETTNNDIAPFKALFNDMQSKDTSKKIRSILRNKKEKGLFLGSSASYGYNKDPSNKHKLIVDPYASKIVKKIFDLAITGKSNKDICDFLNNNNIKTPLEYKNKTNKNKHWSKSTIHNILSNQIYLGNMVQGVQAKLNYKSKKRIVLDKNNWIIVSNTHQPLITEEKFFLANKRKIRNKIKRDKLLLEGLLYCYECSSSMIVKVDKRNINNIHNTLNCNNYVNKKTCTSHFNIYEEIEKNILNNLKTKLDGIDINKIYEKILINKNNDKTIAEEKKIKKNLLDVYSDKINGIINDYMYKTICQNIKQELELLKITNKKNIKFKRINMELNRNLINFLINKITISKNKEITIYYNFH